MPKSRAADNQNYRARQKARGFVWFTQWVTPAEKKFILAALAEIRSRADPKADRSQD